MNAQGGKKNVRIMGYLDKENDMNKERRKNSHRRREGNTVRSEQEPQKGQHTWYWK